MPGSYSTDLRERVLVAVEAGEPADVVAEAYMISAYQPIAPLTPSAKSMQNRL